MDGPSLAAILLLLLAIGSWQLDARARDLRGIHYHSKRHMLPGGKRRTTTPRAREIRKKPSGHLAPLQEEEIADDEIVSVAVGPPARPKYEKLVKSKTTNSSSPNAVSFLKDVIIEIAKDIFTREVNEDFAFAQYISTAIKNIKADKKRKLQHDIIEMIHQQINKEVSNTVKPIETTTINTKQKANETEEVWTDFTNLENIVG